LAGASANLSDTMSSPPLPLTYAVGDIHGSLDKLRRLVVQCDRHADGRPMTWIFLGDYIDRGPDSRGVIETLMALQTRAPGQVVTLMGNHEGMLLGVLDRGGAARLWHAQGGVATLQSYGVSSAGDLPPPHLDWVRALRLRFDDGRRFFVHAGVNPSVALDAQEDFDLLWIREPFLSDRRAYGRLIVHGHTPVSTGVPELRSNRLNLDTGAVFGGPLTAAVFDDTQTEPIAFLQSD
jgi:serine/threonine protein phosphatase 1